MKNYRIVYREDCSPWTKSLIVESNETETQVRKWWTDQHSTYMGPGVTRCSVAVMSVKEVEATE
jgi:hypothetical protein